MIPKRAGIPRRTALFAPGVRAELREYPNRVRRIVGRAIEVAQWGRGVYEIVVEGDHVTYRAMYYSTKDPDGTGRRAGCFRQEEQKRRQNAGR